MGWKGFWDFKYGVLQAPLGPDLSGPELVAAVANSGCLGFLRAPDRDSPVYMQTLIDNTRKLTKKPFGVGIIPYFPYEENLKVILKAKVYVLQVNGGFETQCESKDVIKRAHDAKIKVIFQVGTVEGAKKAIAAGVDGIIMQGYEAGGHKLGRERLCTLVPKVVELVKCKNIPIIAAGGIICEKGYERALELGAQAVSMGTRFVATKECFAHPKYKQMILDYTETQYTDIFGRERWDCHHRVLATPFVKKWSSKLPANVTEKGQPIIGHTNIYNQCINIRRFAGIAPNKTTTGKLEDMVMYAGEGVGGIHEIISAGDLIKTTVAKCHKLYYHKRPHLRAPMLD